MKKLRWYVYTRLTESSNGIEVLQLHFFQGEIRDAVTDLDNSVRFGDGVDTQEYYKRIIAALHTATGATSYVQRTYHRGEFTLRTQRILGEVGAHWYGASVKEAELTTETVRALLGLANLDDGVEAIAHLKATHLEWIESASHYVVATNAPAHLAPKA